MARQKRPTVPHAVSQHVVNTYVKMRRDAQEDEKAHTYTSATKHSSTSTSSEWTSAYTSAQSSFARTASSV